MLSIFIGLVKPLGLCLIMIIGGVISRPSDFSMSECEEDFQCSENHFCFEKRRCVVCYNCTSYLREPHAWKHCSKKPTECGNCLTGYKVEILTYGEERDYCIPVEKEKLLESGGIQSTNYLAPLLIGVAVTVAVIVFGCYLIYYWRKARLRNGEQAAQVMQNSSHASTGNGLSPLLAGTHAKAAIEERMTFEKPSVPSQPPASERPSAPPPPYEANTSQPVIEIVPATVFDKLCTEANRREHGYKFPSMPSDDNHGEDQESEGDSDVETSLHSESYIETGIPLHYHDEETVLLSDIINYESDMPISNNAGGPSFQGIFSNNGTSTYYNETYNSDSGTGLSTASSMSLTSSEEANGSDGARAGMKRQRLECGCYSRPEIKGDCSCRSEDCPSKRNEQTIGQAGSSVELDSEVSTFSGVIPNLDDSGVSQASSSKSINLSVELQDETELPANKKQKLDSNMSSRSEQFEGGDIPRSPDIPVVDSPIMNFTNKPNDL